MPIENDLTDEERADFASHGEPMEGAQPRDDAGRFAPAAEEQPQAVEQPASQEQQPEQQGTQQAEQPASAENQQPKLVPHEALHAERLRSAQLARTAQLATTRMNALLAAQAERERGQQTEMPPIEEDPAGYVQAIEARLSAFEFERQQETEKRQLATAIEDDERLFQSTTPDYENASEHYVKSRAAELLHFYNPQQAQQILEDEVRSIARESWQRGLSAAQTIYALAQARGYTPGASSTSAAQPQSPATSRVSPTAQVQAIKEGQAASRSLGGTGGGGGAAQLNADALLNMTDEEFEAYLKLGTKGANARFAGIAGG